MAVLGALLAGTAAAVALTGEFPHEASLAERHALIILTPIAVGLYAWSEGTHRRFGRLLVLAGVGWFFASLAASSDPVLHSVGRVSTWVVEAGLFYLILAFPSGRLNARVDRVLAWCAVALVVILYVPTALISETFPTPSHVTTCGADCPDNVFMLLGTEPAFLDGLVIPLRELLTVALVIAVTARLISRVRHATRLMRRTLTPVVIVAILRLAALASALILRRAGAGDTAVDFSTAALSLALPVLSFGFLLGLLSWRIHTADALVNLAGWARDQDGPADLATSSQGPWATPALSWRTGARRPAVGGSTPTARRRSCRARGPSAAPRSSSKTIDPTPPSSTTPRCENSAPSWRLSGRTRSYGRTTNA